MNQLDDFGQMILDRFDQMIADAKENKSYLMSLKEQTMGNWPWSAEKLPPVDREMLAASKAARERGDMGKEISELIRDLTLQSTGSIL